MFSFWQFSLLELTQTWPKNVKNTISAVFRIKVFLYFKFRISLSKIILIPYYLKHSQKRSLTQSVRFHNFTLRQKTSWIFGYIQGHCLKSFLISEFVFSQPPVVQHILASSCYLTLHHVPVLSAKMFSVSLPVSCPWDVTQHNWLLSAAPAGCSHKRQHWWMLHPLWSSFSVLCLPDATEDDEDAHFSALRVHPSCSKVYYWILLFFISLDKEI